VADKQYALLPHGVRCDGCESEGDHPIEWNGEEHLAFIFDSFESMNAFTRIGMCQKCQDAVRH
jgi:hypothetical protein